MAEVVRETTGEDKVTVLRKLGVQCGTLIFGADKDRQCSLHSGHAGECK